MQPYDHIEESIKRTNTNYRLMLQHAHLEPDEELKEQFNDLAVQARDRASDLYDLWSDTLVIDMQDWEQRSGVTLQELTNTNANLQRSITELEKAIVAVETAVRAIQRIEAMVTTVAKIAAI